MKVVYVTFMFSFLLHMSIASESNHNEDIPGRCLKSPIISGNGKFVLYDCVVNVQSGKVYFIGPLNKLWIVPETPPELRNSVSWVDNFGEGKISRTIPATLSVVADVIHHCNFKAFC
jgi:hypothetical protein